MNDELVAIIGAVVLAALVRFANILIQWLSRVLGVSPPADIPAGPASEYVKPKRQGLTPVDQGGTQGAGSTLPADDQHPKGNT